MIEPVRARVKSLVNKNSLVKNEGLVAQFFLLLVYIFCSCLIFLFIWTNHFDLVVF
jgi:hypothetical protein